MTNANNTTMTFGRVAEATRNYGGPNNATMNGKYYATNLGRAGLYLYTMTNTNNTTNEMTKEITGVIQEGEFYFTIDQCGDIVEYVWDDVSYEMHEGLSKPYFKTYEEALYFNIKA